MFNYFVIEPNSFVTELFRYENDDLKEKTQETLRELNKDLSALGFGSPVEIKHYNDDRWYIENYPSRWATSSRYATALVLPKEFLKSKKILGKGIKEIGANNEVTFKDYNDNIISAYDDTLINLKKLRKRYRLRFFGPKAAAKNKIDLAIKQLETILECEGLKYLYSLMHQTADALICDFKQRPNAKHYEEQIKHLVDFSTLDPERPEREFFFNTANDSLNFTNEANKLRNKLKYYAEQIFLLEEDLVKAKVPDNDFFKNYWETEETLIQRIHRRSLQIGYIAKLLSEPFYDKPREKTKSEKIRGKLRISTGVIAGICGILLIISLIYFPPLALLITYKAGIILSLKLGTMIASYIVGDKFYENCIRHITHGRSPNKKQVFELSFTVAVASLYLVGAHAATILAKVGAIIPWIGKKLVPVMSFFSSLTDFVNNKINYASNLSHFKEIYDPAQEIAAANFVANATQPAATKVYEIKEKSSALDFFRRHKSLAQAEFLLIRIQPVLTRWKAANTGSLEAKTTFASNNKKEITHFLKQIHDWVQNHERNESPDTKKLITQLQKVEAVLKVIERLIPQEELENQNEFPPP